MGMTHSIVLFKTPGGGLARNAHPAWHNFLSANRAFDIPPPNDWEEVLKNEYGAEYFFDAVANLGLLRFEAQEDLMAWLLEWS
jgi:hypothetical protein